MIASEPAVTGMQARRPAPWGETRLSRLAAVMCCVVAIGGALSEIALAWVWLSPSWITKYVAPHAGVDPALVHVDWTVQAAGFAVSMVPLGVLLYALHQAYGLFDSYRRGELFPDSAPRRLRRIGLAMLALAVLRPISAAALSAVLTFANPPGQKLLVIGFSVEDYMIAVFGGLLMAIGHVMTEARRLADDNSQIV